ncbi:Uncharacterized protein dnm_021920 [Desulfonema magnum]|uniref:Uncharacterized protein n=1 Tax=Desulfonema magnum TaxID=45655 RepID=A0A975GLT0_9BACT|nr:Uncharacterized protein dnm_021920 [Desulfonema magnum]
MINKKIKNKWNSSFVRLFAQIANAPIFICIVCHYAENKSTSKSKPLTGSFVL